MKTKWETYKELELIPDSVLEPRFHYLSKQASSIWNWLNIIWDILNDWLIYNSEPHIYEMRDRDGTVFWRVYDPVTKNTYSFSSRNEVVDWLESRYYH